MPTGPIDVGAVHHDDEFIDDLAAGRAARIGDDAEYRLAGLLAQWRAESLAGPVPSTPTIADIETAIARANERERRGGLARRLRVVSGAAAILAVAGAGLLVLSEGSQPGDPLWSVKQVVFSEQAQQTQSRMNAEQNIAEAKKALAAGDTVKARELIAKAEKDIGPLKDKSEADQLRSLIEDVRRQDPSALIPPLSSLPSLPLPTSATSPDVPDPTVMLKPPGSSSGSSSPSTAPSTTQEPSTSKTDTDKPTTTTSSATASASVTTTAPSESIR
ncbi:MULTISPECIES: anti-sigma-D factor RsdA [Gordonia]|nr:MULTISPECIES: anti-sigma-D factor RsdA [Gordonia]WFN93893.1 anti-sigma-D factor RsdA [Gordonia sihwensis]